MSFRSLITRGHGRWGFATSCMTLIIAVVVLAPPAASAEEPALQVSVTYAAHGSYQMSETGEIDRQADAEFGWSDLFPPLGAIELSGPTVSGPGVGPGNANGMNGYLVEGDPGPAGPAGEFSSSQAGSHGTCGATGNLEARAPQLWVTPEITEAGGGTNWNFEIKEAGRFVDASPSSGDDCGLAGHTGVDDVFWDNWVEQTQSGGDQIDRSFKLTSQELHGSREIVLPVSYDQAVNAEGWGGGDYCTLRVEACTVSFGWSGTVTLKIAPAEEEGEAPPAGPGGGTGPGSGPAPPPASAPSTGGSGDGCLVPRLRGKKLGKARKLLASAGCKLGKVEERRATRAHRGKVTAQAKAPGRRLHAGTAVGVTVGR
jgi:hypothetical protein